MCYMKAIFMGYSLLVDTLNLQFLLFHFFANDFYCALLVCLNGFGVV